MFLLSKQDNADPVLLGDHDVALASIEKVVVGTYSRTSSHQIKVFDSYVMVVSDKGYITSYHSNVM